MGMIVCPFHGEQMIGFLSRRVDDSIRNNLDITQEMIRLTITDKNFEFSSSQLMLKEEVENFMEIYERNLFIHIDELNQLSIPHCGKCIKSFLEKNVLIPKDKELFLTWIE
jgi:hypothetical protein